METGLYYLQTRYYDPEVCRFISADDISYLAPESINGLNLYAYCLDNPIKYIDFLGYFAITISILVGLGIFLIVAGFLIYIETQYHPIQKNI